MRNRRPNTWVAGLVLAALTSGCESEEPAAFPAYGRMMLGDDGVVWIEGFPRAGGPNEWFALSEAGERLRSLTVPSGTVLLDIGSNWVLVTHRDEVEVERVALHSLVGN